MITIERKQLQKITLKINRIEEEANNLKQLITKIIVYQAPVTSTECCCSLFRRWYTTEADEADTEE